jgi:hypothetical protein
MATHQGSCHCGRIAFTVEGEVEEVIDCNCSMCRRKGALLAAFPREALTLSTPDADMATYHFNKHAIDHHFCPDCGIAPFSEGKGRDGKAMTMVNVRCLDGVDLSKLKITTFDGASH